MVRDRREESHQRCKVDDVVVLAPLLVGLAERVRRILETVLVNEPADPLYLLHESSGQDPDPELPSEDRERTIKNAHVAKYTSPTRETSRCTYRTWIPFDGSWSLSVKDAWRQHLSRMNSTRKRSLIEHRSSGVTPICVKFLWDLPTSQRIGNAQ